MTSSALNPFTAANWESSARASLRRAAFHKADSLIREAPFEFIFIDAGHRYEEVLNDSRRALEVLSPNGCVVWHDYRLNEFFNPGLEVPEALSVIRKLNGLDIRSVPATTCAVLIQTPDSAA
jgi:predicted O-methyltransferase YrrM